MLTKSLFGFVFTLLLSTTLTAFAQNSNPQINTIGIYGDSHTITKGKHQKDVYQLGKLLAQSQKKLIVDGQTEGLSGKFLQGAYESKGNIEIVTTPAQYHKNCPQTHFCQHIPYELTKTPELAQEKRTDSADMYVILPGGLDSLTTFSDLIALQKQLKENPKEWAKKSQKSDASTNGLNESEYRSNQKTKPIILLNSNHYFDNLRNQLSEMKRQNVISDSDVDFIGFAEKPKEVLPLAQKLINQPSKVNF